MPIVRRVLGLVACSSVLVACSATDGTRIWPRESTGGMGTPPGAVDLGSWVSTTPATGPQSILVLDLRSGWWSGGGGGSFSGMALPRLAQATPGTTVEYHHFENAVQVRCLVAGIAAPTCDGTDGPVPTTPASIVALFGKPHWNDYTQVWILSGSVIDVTDVDLAGALFNTFLTETQGSCIPVLIGAGDGFISHGNAVAKQLGIGEVLSTERPTPGFFSVAGAPPVTIETRMYAGKQLSTHAIFENVDSIADTISVPGQELTHGDSIAESPSLQIVAHDTDGRAAIAVGSVTLPTGDRPFVIDAGFQRFYAVKTGEDTQIYLANLVRYLGGVGCKAEPDR